MTKKVIIALSILLALAILYAIFKPAKVVETLKIQKVTIRDTKTIAELSRQIRKLKTEKMEMESRMSKETVKETFDKDGKVASRETTTQTTDTNTKKTIDETTTGKTEAKKTTDETVATTETTEKKKTTESGGFGLYFGPAIYMNVNLAQFEITGYNLENLGLNLGARVNNYFLNIFYLHINGSADILGATIMVQFF